MYIKSHTYKTTGHKHFRYIWRAPTLQMLCGVEYTFCIPVVTIELAQTHNFLKVKGGSIDNCARTIALNPHSLGTVSSLITPHLTFHHWSLDIACFTKLYLMFVMFLINCKTEWVWVKSMFCFHLDLDTKNVKQKYLENNMWSVIQEHWVKCAKAHVLFCVIEKEDFILLISKYKKWSWSILYGMIYETAELTVFLKKSNMLEVKYTERFHAVCLLVFIIPTGMISKRSEANIDNPLFICTAHLHLEACPVLVWSWEGGAMRVCVYLATTPCLPAGHCAGIEHNWERLTSFLRVWGGSDSIILCLNGVGGSGRRAVIFVQRKEPELDEKEDNFTNQETTQVGLSFFGPIHLFSFLSFLSFVFSFFGLDEVTLLEKAKIT